ncbi:hypothetical protein CVT24_008319 [Panaeolus cyanescens]|uniref:Uncharacterized protein n=1 Tax=Panaeolus cyanescens TaxID=181874 RepID=A0A409YMZ8_9AGAR|nr:hypothetical protein CVT24_008319 [Panaeolus cyanescens]
MAKITFSSIFVMALLASPSFALWFSSEPRGIEDMDAREFDVMFRREVQAHKDIWVQVDEKLRVIDLPWFPFLAKTFLTHYRDLVMKHNKKHGHTTPVTSGGPAVSSPSPSAPAGSGAPTGTITTPGIVIPPVTIPVPMPLPPASSPPIIPDTMGAKAQEAREYIQDLISRTYATFSGAELDSRGFSDEEFFAREPQLQYTDELYERSFGYDDEDVYSRGFEDDDLFERGYETEEINARQPMYEEDMYEARGYDDFEEVNARGYADEVDEQFARDEAFEEMFGRDYDFDDLD